MVCVFSLKECTFVHKQKSRKIFPSKINFDFLETCARMHESKATIQEHHQNKLNIALFALSVLLSIIAQFTISVTE